MATKKTFSISEYIQPENVSNLDRPEASETVVKIPLEHICENERNFYDTSNVGELANSIALNGLLEPVIVCKDHCDPDSGAQYYRLISGHRRFKAFSKLAETEPEKYKSIPAIIREPKNTIVEELMLIEANRATRVMSSADTLKQAERYKELLVSLKEQGVEIPGRLRDVVAEAMNISASRLARLEVIRKGLISEYAEDFEAGRINESAAYELARLLPAHQKQIHGNVKITDYPTAYISTLGEKLNMYFGPGLKCNRNRDAKTQTPGYCDHGAEMWEVSRKKYIYNMCRGCCADCYDRLTCKSVCSRVAPDVEKEKENRKKKDDEVKAQRKQVEAERDNYVTTFWTREKAAREAAGITPEDAFSRLEAMYKARGTYAVLDDYKDLLQQENGCPNDPEDADDDYWRDVDDPNDLDVVSAFADLYGCSVDYLMGRSAKLGGDTVETAPAVASGKTEDGQHWRDIKSDPPEDDAFIIALLGDSDDTIIAEEPVVRAFQYKGGKVRFPELSGKKYSPTCRIRGWVPMPLREESKNANK